MGKTVKYAFFTCTLAYLIAAVLLFIFSVAQTGWSRIDNDIVTFLPSGLTLGLFEFKWWGGFYYLAILVPWLGSTVLLVLLLHWFKGEAKRRRLLGGLSIGVYYFAMIMVYFIDKMATWWGHIIPPDFLDILFYLMFFICPVCGFGVGYLAGFIVERILKPQFAD